MPASSASRARCAPLRAGSASSMPSCGTRRLGPSEQPLERRARLDHLRAGAEVDQARRSSRGGSPARGSPRSRGRRAGRRRRRRRARRSRARPGRCRRRSGRRARRTHRRGSARRRSAPRRCRSRGAGERSTRAASTRPRSRSARAGRRSRRSRPSRRTGWGSRSAGSVRVKISVRTVCRPVSRRSRKGELAETASSSGSSLAQPVADGDRPVGAAHAHVDVQAPGVVALRNPAQFVRAGGCNAACR